MFFYDPVILIISGAIMLASWYVSSTLKRKFRTFSQIPLSSGLSGAEIAQKMLKDSDIHDVRVLSVPGALSDHYNPEKKTVNLSEAVYHGRNAAAAAVAAHECGHAVQHARDYSFLEFRSLMVPVLSYASNWMHWVILAGIFLLQTTPVPLAIGVGLFALTTLFSFVTLPVEFDASKRALAWIERNGVVNSREHAMSKEALNWAALSYVVAALGSLATLLYYASLLLGGGRDD